jgi:putative transposase
MKHRRKRYGADLKARVALEAIQEVKTVNEIAAQHGIHPSQVAKWKGQVLEELPGIFSVRQEKRQREQDGLTAELYQQIGRLQMELSWLKKKTGTEY